jgi:sugar phosphate isomerase/epimerase
MPYTRCFSTLGCPEASLAEVAALAARHGIAHVEVRALGGSMKLPEYLAATYGTPGRLAEILRGGPVRVAAFDTSLRLVGSTAADRRELAELAPWAEALGVRWLRVFDGGTTANSQEMAEAGETLRAWRSLRAECGWQVDVMVETHDALFTADAIGRFRAAQPETAILWDAHHTWRKGGEDPVVTWRAIREAVVHVHVKDSIGVPSARHPYTYVLPGDGQFPIGRMLSALQADNYGGLVCLEWERVWHPYLPPLEAALTAAAARGWW